MKIRNRIFLVFVLAIAAAFFGLVSWMQDEMRPRVLEAQEEPLVDTAYLLAAIVAEHGRRDADGTWRPDLGFIENAFATMADHPISAQIYGLHKQRVDVRVYVTDAAGTVLFDSDGGRDLRADYSRWRDVHLTLQGKYGARSTDGDPLFAEGATMYIAAPIRAGGEIVGVVSVGKPERNAERFLAATIAQLERVGMLAALSAILIAFVLYRWMSRPLERLHAYTRALQAGGRVAPPRLGRNEIGRVADAMAEMRSALDGTAYVSGYIQALTHELKSPAAAIRGAAELLREDMPAADRRRFVDNVLSEARRMQDIIERLLQLAAIEHRQGLTDPEPVELDRLLSGVAESLRPLAIGRGIAIKTRSEPDMTVSGDALLLDMAVTNLVKNALEFSPDSGVVRLEAARDAGQVTIAVTDAGPGIPEYALHRVFDRFYSLPRPNGRKGTGLGLSFVREIMALHAGQVEFRRPADGGTQAVLRLPVHTAA